MTSDAAEGMSPERFAAVTESYGADWRRWPAADREAARRLEASGDAAARHLLSEAAELDRLLDGYVVAAPSDALYRSIASGAPAAATRRVGLRLWWSGLGLAAAGLAGAFAGASAIAVAAPALHAPTGWNVYEATAFGDLAVEDQL